MPEDRVAQRSCRVTGEESVHEAVFIVLVPLMIDVCRLRVRIGWSVFSSSSPSGSHPRYDADDDAQCASPFKGTFRHHFTMFGRVLSVTSYYEDPL